MRVYVPDIECDSCVKLISKKLQSQGITNLKVNLDSVDVPDDKKNVCIATIRSLGFRADTNPFERKTIKERWRDWKENPKKYKIEFTGLQYLAGVIGILAGLYAVAYFSLLKNIPDFTANYGWWMFYLIISIAVVAIGMWHYYAYNAKVTCMVGMMIGMTFGMQTGMMIGAIIGATNGFFVGALSGMLIGTAVGSITGKCCGVMGVMEGMMAGVMGGTMGPMISVMMFSDNLLIFMPFYMIINIIIVLGLSYMLFEEVVEHNAMIKKEPLDFMTLASICVVIATALAALMVYGPSSSLISF